MAVKTLDKYRAFLHPTGTDAVSVEVETYPGFRNDGRPIVDIDLSFHLGYDKAYLEFGHTRGRAASIKRARAKFDKLMKAMDIIDKHIRDAEDNIEVDRDAARNATEE